MHRILSGASTTSTAKLLEEVELSFVTAEIIKIYGER